VSRKSETFIEDGKSQQQLEEELGPGVEKKPILPEKPKLEQAKLDFGKDVFDVNKIIDEISKLPASKDATIQTTKYDEYQVVARKIWVIKQSEKDSIMLRMREIESKEGNRYIWKRDEEGKIAFTTKRFYYTPVTVQEKQEIFKLDSARRSLEYDVALEGQKLRNLGDKYADDPDAEILKKKAWVEISHNFFAAVQEYNLTAFRAYYGGTDEEIDRLFFEDIVNAVDVALYKEGVRSPQ
jgi:hypothetical protein